MFYCAVIAAASCTCARGWYRCEGGQECVPGRRLCDGQDDCPYHEDEDCRKDLLNFGNDVHGIVFMFLLLKMMFIMTFIVRTKQLPVTCKLNLTFQPNNCMISPLKSLANQNAGKQGK